MMGRRRKLLFIAPLAIVGIAALCFIGGETVMRLWNWITPALFGFHEITFWQAFGLLALCRILFGRLGGPRFSRSSIRHRIEERVAERMGQRWDTMTPEERERFRQGIRGGRCGFG